MLVCFWRFLSFRAGVGVVPAFFVLPTPPRSVPGRRLGNRAIKWWLRTVCFSCSYFFRPADPPPLGAGSDLGIFATLTVAQDCVIFFLLFFGGTTSPRLPSLKLWRYFGLSLFRRQILAPRPLSGDGTSVFLDVFPVPYG